MYVRFHTSDEWYHEVSVKELQAGNMNVKQRFGVEMFSSKMGSRPLVEYNSAVYRSSKDLEMAALLILYE